MDNIGIVGAENSADESNAREKSNKNIVLKIVLSVLVLCVIGLMVWLAVLRLPMRGESGDVSCENKKDLVEIEKCIDPIYIENGLDAAVAEYGRAIDKARDDGDEQLFYELVMDRSLMLATDGKCIQAVDLIEDKVVEDMPVSASKGVFYSRAIGLSSSCGDEKRAEIFKEKLMEVNNSYDE